MYKVDIEGKTLTKLKSPLYRDLNLKERFDIQEWVESDATILGEELMIIAKELVLPSKKRLDLLAIDKKGCLVVIELKRDFSGSEIEWQSIKYASYFSSLEDKEIIQIYANYAKYSLEQASADIEEFLNLEEDWKIALNKQQRIILVAGQFNSDVISAVLWLREHTVDISCVELSPFVDDKQLFIQANILIPIKEAREFVHKWDLKQQEEKIFEQQRQHSFSLSVSEYDETVLMEKLTESLTRKSNLTDRLIKFFKILLSNKKALDREEVKQYLFNAGVGSDIGHTGRLLSNISQFLTKENNDHLRQLVSFSGGEFFGAVKSDYYLNNKYRNLVNQVLNQITDTQ